MTAHVEPDKDSTRLPPSTEPMLSVIVTLFDEEDNIEPLTRQVEQALVGLDYELILIDDGSRDQTVQRIQTLSHPKTRLVHLRKNYGQTSAMAAGIEVARGRYIATMDGDLQNDPKDIPMMLEKLIDNDWDVVAGRRADRQDGMFLRKVPSKIANALIRRLTGVYLNDYGCSLRVYKSQVAKELELYGELHRFIPVLLHLQGASMTEVNVQHHARVHGQSKYGLNRTLKVLSDLVLMLFLKRYLQRPIHIFGGIGIVALLVGGGIYAYLFILKLFGADIWGRPLLMVGLLFLLGGMQSLFFGVIAELAMRVYFRLNGQGGAYKIRQVEDFHHKASSS